MTTLTIKQTYCAFCEWVANFFNGVCNTLLLLGYSRTAAELSRMGYHEEARNLMIEKLKLLKESE
jgi:hypothetical protein